MRTFAVAATVTVCALGARADPDWCKLTHDQPIQYLHPNGKSTVETFQIVRPPLTPEQAEACDPENHPECTAIYEITLTPEYTTGPPNCNDLGMLPPHGRDQRTCSDPEKNGLSPVQSQFWEDRDRKDKMQDYTNHPFPNDPIKQSVAAGANAHTSLMEETKNCNLIDNDWQGITDDSVDVGGRNRFMPNGNTNRQCAFPLGFMSDAIIKNKAICVSIFGAQDRWVEIMAASASGSNGGSFCVSDWGAGDEQACTKEGDLYECREAGRSQATKKFNGRSVGHQMRVKFQAFDNIDDAHLEIHWRIVASKLPEGTTGEGTEEKDAEDWCQFRDAADFPQSLMGAYPKNFNGNPVFDVETSSASGLAPALALIMAVVAAVLSM